MRYQISGTVMQTVAIDLAPGETVYSQTNTMAWMNDQISMNTHTGGGLFAGLMRTFGGGSLFITDFTANGNGHVAFAPRFPGTIMPALLQAGPIADLPQGDVPGRREIGVARNRLAEATSAPASSAATVSSCRR